MGQAMGIIGVAGKSWRKNQLRKITDKIFERISGGRDTMSCLDLQEATLLVYNDVNKHWPGPHLKPPTFERFDRAAEEYVKKVVKKSDENKDQVINRDEFLGFILHLTTDALLSVRGKALSSVRDKLPILTLVVAPMVAVVTKKSSEGIPGIGKIVQKLPSSAYALLITLVAITFQNPN